MRNRGAAVRFRGSGVKSDIDQTKSTDRTRLASVFSPLKAPKKQTLAVSFLLLMFLFSFAFGQSGRQTPPPPKPQPPAQQQGRRPVNSPADETRPRRATDEPQDDKPVKL